MITKIIWCSGVVLVQCLQYDTQSMPKSLFNDDSNTAEQLNRGDIAVYSDIDF